MDYDMKELRKLIERSLIDEKEQRVFSPFDSKGDPFDLFKKLTPIVAATVVKSSDMNLNVTISIADTTGEIIFCYRMPNSILASLEISRKKAYTAVAMKVTTKSLHDKCQPGSDLHQLETVTNGKVVTFGGGVPLMSRDKRLVGGVGVSGAPTSDEDHELASFCANEFQKCLLI